MVFVGFCLVATVAVNVIFVSGGSDEPVTQVTPTQTPTSSITFEEWYNGIRENEPEMGAGVFGQTEFETDVEYEEKIARIRAEWQSNLQAYYSDIEQTTYEVTLTHCNYESLDSLQLPPYDPATNQFILKPDTFGCGTVDCCVWDMEELVLPAGIEYTDSCMCKYHVQVPVEIGQYIRSKADGIYILLTISEVSAHKPGTWMSYEINKMTINKAELLSQSGEVLYVWP